MLMHETYKDCCFNKNDIKRRSILKRWSAFSFAQNFLQNKATNAKLLNKIIIVALDKTFNYLRLIGGIQKRHLFAILELKRLMKMEELTCRIISLQTIWN